MPRACADALADAQAGGSDMVQHSATESRTQRACTLPQSTTHCALRIHSGLGGIHVASVCVSVCVRVCVRGQEIRRREKSMQTVAVHSSHAGLGQERPRTAVGRVSMLAVIITVTCICGGWIHAAAEIAAVSPVC
jgi:hypothetical protein